MTYYRSRSARIDEVQAVTGGAGDFYDPVYQAERPELFYQASPHRVVGPGEPGASAGTPARTYPNRSSPLS